MTIQLRQIAFVEFERRVHDERRQSELTADRINQIWIDVQGESLGPALRFDDEYKYYWTYIPHFIHTRFYTYAYAFAHLASLTLYALYREDGDAFTGPYLDFLGTGGAASPGEQLGAFGIDLADAATWSRGLDEMERMLDLAIAG